MMECWVAGDGGKSRSNIYPWQGFPRKQSVGAKRVGKLSRHLLWTKTFAVSCTVMPRGDRTPSARRVARLVADMNLVSIWGEAAVFDRYIGYNNLMR